jgi:hypothetical protein
MTTSKATFGVLQRCKGINTPLLVSTDIDSKRSQTIESPVQQPRATGIHDLKRRRISAQDGSQKGSVFVL